MSGCIKHFGQDCNSDSLACLVCHSAGAMGSQGEANMCHIQAACLSQCTYARRMCVQHLPEAGNIWEQGTSVNNTHKLHLHAEAHAASDVCNSQCRPNGSADEPVKWTSTAVADFVPERHLWRACGSQKSHLHAEAHAAYSVQDRAEGLLALSPQV